VGGKGGGGELAAPPLSPTSVTLNLKTQCRMAGQSGNWLNTGVASVP